MSQLKKSINVCKDNFFVTSYFLFCYYKYCHVFLKNHTFRIRCLFKSYYVCHMINTNAFESVLIMDECTIKVCNDRATTTFDLK